MSGKITPKKVELYNKSVSESVYIDQDNPKKFNSMYLTIFTLLTKNIFQKNPTYPSYWVVFTNNIYGQMRDKLNNTLA